MGCLSFHPRKIVTTGEGGAVTTSDAELAAAIRRLRHHGLDPRRQTSPSPSINYRLADILCAIGIPQLRRLDELLAGAGADRGRVHGAARWRSSTCPTPARATRHGWQAYVIRLDRRDEAMETLRAEGIEVQIGTYALHHLSALPRPGAVPGRRRAPSSARWRCRSTSTADRRGARPRRRGDRRAFRLTNATCK